jgi:hypothetical protein
MSTRTKLPEREVLEEVAHRDRREYPVMTITEIAERFPEVTRKTVQRKVKSLTEAGDLHERKHGAVGVYWVDHDESEGVCPDCGGVLEKNGEYEPGYWCRSCEAAFGQIRTGNGLTAYGQAVMRGSRALAWWRSLPSRFQRAVAYTAGKLFTDEEPPGGDLEDGGYRPERIRIDDDELPDLGSNDDDDQRQ